MWITIVLFESLLLTLVLFAGFKSLLRNKEWDMTQLISIIVRDNIPILHDVRLLVQIYATHFVLNCFVRLFMTYLVNAVLWTTESVRHYQLLTHIAFFCHLVSSKALLCINEADISVCSH